MPKYIFAYHGGKVPETPEEGQQVMARWEAWFSGLGAAVVDAGNPAGLSMTVSASGVAEGGGANPVSGYSLVTAGSMAQACEIAKGCPMIDDGTVEVAEAIDM